MSYLHLNALARINISGHAVAQTEKRFTYAITRALFTAFLDFVRLMSTIINHNCFVNYESHSMFTTRFRHTLSDFKKDRALKMLSFVHSREWNYLPEE